MRFIREKLRKLKYNLRFYGKKNELNFSFISNSKQNQELTDLMNFYGSDKGGKKNHHNYSSYYSEIFFHRKNDVKNFLEIGIGTNNTSLISNMGEDGVPLASLRAWRAYFKNANIYGADIDKNILNNEEKISTFYVDQRDPKSIKQLFNNIGNVEFDVILEDGLHKYEANICFFENSIDYLEKNGIYIIEDVNYKDQTKFIKYFQNKNYNFSIVDIYHKKNIYNNCLVIIKKNL